MNKWEAMVAIVIAIGLFGALISVSLTGPNSTEMAKAGLEECPKQLGYSNTIWVKDCVKYTNTLREIEKD